MNLIKSSIKNPVAVLVVVIFVLLFGYLSVVKLPYALVPQVSRPVISIYTSWSGASPYEVEKEIIDPQERVLKSLDSLVGMSSVSRSGGGSIGLEFELGVDINATLLKVSQRLGEIRKYPNDVQKPVIRASGENIPPSIYLFLKTLPENKKDITNYRVDFFENIVPIIERVDGVGEVSVWGGRNIQMQIIINSQLLAYNNITINDVVKSIRSSNISVSAGSLDYGSRSYRVRVNSQYDNKDKIYNTVIKNENGRVIRLRDVARVNEGYSKSDVYSFHNEDDAISVRIHPTAFANILDLTNRIEQEVKILNDTKLKDMGIFLEWSRDQRGYIQDSIELVKQNILYGILFATIVLYLFLRNIASVLVVLFVVPVSTFGTFVVLDFFGRSLNVVSLAGISFAVSMLVDNAIVVLENITRHKSMGKSIFKSSVDGAREVVGALFASVLTTVAIFVPILGLKSESGQLFYDIALASSGALIISFFASLFLIPMLSYKFFGFIERFSGATSWIKNIFMPLDYVVGKIYFLFSKLIEFSIKNALTRIVSIVSLLGLSLYLAIVFMPKIDYLPKGSQNFLISYLNAPSGLSYEQRKEIAKSIYEQNKFLLTTQGYKQESKESLPAIKDLFFIGNATFMMVGVVAQDGEQVRSLMPQISQSIKNIPAIRGSVIQQGIFDSGGGGLSIDLYVSGNNIDSIVNLSKELMDKIKDRLPNSSIRAVPALEVNNRELNFYPYQQSLVANGMDSSMLGEIVSVVMEGKKIGEYKNSDGNNIDLILKSSGVKTPEDLMYAQVYTPQGNIVPLYSLADIREEYGMTQIRHFERKRSVILIMTPPKDMPLQEAMEIVQKDILPEVDLGDNEVSLKGAGNKLMQTIDELKGGFILAVVIIYLLLCALYGNFVYPFVIIFTIPFALSGAFIGLYLTNRFIAPQALDILAMFGLIILVGSVVNNAILIVYQSLINVREYKLCAKKAVLDSTLSRIRPIYMSMLTSVCGLLPLVIFQGSGSEIYRGLGSVIVGGLVFSSVISIFVIPALLLFFLKTESKPTMH